MFFKFNRYDDVTKRLHPTYKGQIESVGPLLGALFIRARIERKSHPIIPSVVDARLTGISYGIWEDISVHLGWYTEQASTRLGKKKTESWMQKILAMSASSELLLVWTILSLIDAQMHVFGASPNPAQPILLSLLELITQGYEAKMLELLPFEEVNEPNCEIIVPLLAGKTPFTQTFHSSQTVTDWANELEAATVFLLPQVVLLASKNLTSPAKTAFQEGLNEEINAWKIQLPRPNVYARRWNWLPNFGL